jgi:hypothetical protein
MEDSEKRIEGSDGFLMLVRREQRNPVPFSPMRAELCVAVAARAHGFVGHHPGI